MNKFLTNIKIKKNTKLQGQKIKKNKLIKKKNKKVLTYINKNIFKP